jgi:hypothetical protein
MRMRNVALLLVLLVAGLAAGCGGGGSNKENDLEKQVQAACSGDAIDVTSLLPPSFPQIEADKVTYTQESEVGPTQVVEGFFNGNVQEAHDEYQKELKASGYDILFDEVEAPNDSEISWKGEDRTGQVAMRNECGDNEKTYIHITNRPA